MLYSIEYHSVIVVVVIVVEVVIERASIKLGLLLFVVINLIHRLIDFSNIDLSIVL